MERTTAQVACTHRTFSATAPGVVIHEADDASALDNASRLLDKVPQRLLRALVRDEAEHHHVPAAIVVARGLSQAAHKLDALGRRVGCSAAPARRTMVKTWQRAALSATYLSTIRIAT
jgi:hypothetical protein